MAVFRTNSLTTFPILMRGYQAGIPVDYNCTFHFYFVIDGTGVIRYRGAWDDALIRATVDTALAELDLSAAPEVPTAGHRLLANFPNPFNPRTTIPFELAPGPGEVAVRLQILDLRGRVVRTVLDAPRAAGRRHVAVWDGNDTAGRRLPSGVYLVRLNAGGASRTRPITMVK